MSIKPEFSQRIFSGEKRFELRRTPVKVDEGDVVVVYESSPRKAVVGAFVVREVRRGPVGRLWRQLGAEFGVTRTEYRSYFCGAEVAHAIEVGRTVAIEPVALATLRQRFEAFRPPQSYMRWRGSLAGILGSKAARAVTKQ